jgi:hypothetical protein
LFIYLRIDIWLSTPAACACRISDCRLCVMWRSPHGPRIQDQSARCHTPPAFSYVSKFKGVTSGNGVANNSVTPVRHLVVL